LSAVIRSRARVMVVARGISNDFENRIRLPVEGVRFQNPRTLVAEVVRTPFGKRIFNYFRRIANIDIIIYNLLTTDTS
jgi:hypothetical protein